MNYAHKVKARNLWLATIVISLIGVCTATNALAASRGLSLQATNTTQTTTYNGSTYRALIIGNNQYQDNTKRWLSLNTAISDAKAVANLLDTHYGFSDIVLLENATRSTILHALNNLTKRVNPKDSVLVYYAGHGYLDTETNTGYWIPVDAHGEDHTTYLRNSTIRDELSIIASRAKHTLLISDSCFSGTLLRNSTRGAPPATGQDRYYQKVADKKSVQIIAAGGVEYVDDSYSNSGHSPFTYFLLNELLHNDRPVITASELSANVEKAVANNTPQVPESGVLQGAGDELGEFIFLKLDIAIDVKGIPNEKVNVKVHVRPGSSVDKNVIVTPPPAQEAQPKKYRHLPLPTL